MWVIRSASWLLVAELGDANPLDHGGYFVLQSTEPPAGTYVAEYLESPESNDAKYYTVYRFDLSHCTYIAERLMDHPDCTVWFARTAQDLRDLSNHSGMTVDELIQAFCSPDPVQRAIAYRAVGEYHGWSNLDSYPLMLTRYEAKQRYQKLESENTEVF